MHFYVFLELITNKRNLNLVFNFEIDCLAFAFKKEVNLIISPSFSNIVFSMDNWGKGR